jgi:iron(III) transport system ATP-binding protein
MAGLSIRAALRRYAQHAAVDAVSLDIASGELVALLGPSGCGKTTLLRLVAGFERLDGGDIWFDDTRMGGAGVHVAPEHRRVGMVFQSYALWPHMSVAGNVGYPLRVRGLSAAQRAARVAAALEQVGMGDFGGRRPADLSGGQRQRVALARCLVMEPAVVLLDEPLANLDMHLREAMQAEFRAFHAATGATMVYVTHDQAEAMALADRIAVMDRGRLEQLAAPRVLYHEPATAMVAGFVGRGMVVPVEVLGAHEDGGCAARMLGATVRLRCQDASAGPGAACLRAEQLTVQRAPAPDRIAARVVDATYLGPVSRVRVTPLADSNRVLDVELAGEPPAPGAALHLQVCDGWRLPG